jgi:hypothetical protein
VISLALALLAVVVYWSILTLGPQLALAIAAAGAIAASLLALAGVILAYRHKAPTVASWLIGAWTITVLIVGANVVALIASWTTSAQALGGTSAPATVKTISALSIAALAALVEQSGNVINARAAPWLAQTILCRRYDRLFPAQPKAPFEGIAAYRAVTSACHEDQKAWQSVRGRIELFETVAKAVQKGGYAGGDAWEVVRQPDWTLA